jgi:hypothetical protein
VDIYLGPRMQVSLRFVCYLLLAEQGQINLIYDQAAKSLCPPDNEDMFSRANWKSGIRWTELISLTYYCRLVSFTF